MLAGVGIPEGGFISAGVGDTVQGEGVFFETHCGGGGMKPRPGGVRFVEKAPQGEDN